MTSHRRRYVINRDNDSPPASWDNCWEAEPVQVSPRFSCSGPIFRHYANRGTWERWPINCLKILGNIYGNWSRHITQRVKLTETLKWKILFFLSWLSSCRSTNSSVRVNPHGSTEKLKLLLNDSHLEHQVVYVRQSPKPWGTWQHRSSHHQGGNVQNWEIRDSDGAHLSKEARSGAGGHVSTSELTSARMQGSELRNMWWHRNLPLHGGVVQSYSLYDSAWMHAIFLVLT
jgi:hypothetical protein